MDTKSKLSPGREVETTVEASMCNHSPGRQTQVSPNTVLQCGNGFIKSFIDIEQKKATKALLKSIGEDM